MKPIQDFLAMSFLFLLIPSVTSLQCYRCYSDTSWEDCKENLGIATCPDDHDEVCSKIFYDHELHDRETYTKFCDKASQCTNETNPVCKAAKTHKAQCEVHCCTYDFCNAGSATTISGILLASCTVVLLVLVSLLEGSFKHVKTPE